MTKWTRIALLILSIGFGVLGYYSIPDFLRAEDVKLSEIKSVILFFALSIVFLLTLIGFRTKGRWNKWLGFSFVVSIGTCIFYSFSESNFNYFFPIIFVCLIGLILIGLGNLISRTK